MLPETGGRAIGRRWLLVIALCAVTLGAFAVRVLNWRHIFSDSGVRFIAPDAMYHMRRAFAAVCGGLSVPEYDAFMNYPRGFHCNLPPLFDQIIASAALVLGRGAPSPHLVEVVGALLPPVFGALTVVVVFFIARAYMNDNFAVVSAAVFALLPYHIQVSVLGRPDHHVAVVLFSSLLFLLVIRLSRPARPGTMAALSILGGFLLFVNLMTWGGATLFILALFLYFILLVAPAPGREGGPVRAALGGCVLFLSAAAFLSPVAACASPVSGVQVTWVALSRFQVQLLLCCASVLLLLKVLVESLGSCGRGRSAASRALPVALVLAVTGFLVVMTARAGLADFAGAGSRWLLKSDPVQQYVVEGRGLSWGGAVENFSGLLFLFPPALVLIFRRSLREGLPEKGILFCVWSILTGFAAVMQERFSDLFSVNAAVMIACLLSFAFGALFSPAVTAGKGALAGLLARRRSALGVACLVLLCLAACPPARWLAFYGKSARSPHASWDAVYDVCLWLRENTPASQGYRDAAGRPEYSVLACWEMGHAILYIGRRANVANNLIAWEQNREENLKPYRFFAADSVDEAEDILDECGARYVIVDDMVSSGNFARMLDILGMDHDDFFSGEDTPAGRHYTPRKRALDSMAMRLYLDDGEGLKNFALVYESTVERPVAGKMTGIYKVFEYGGPSPARPARLGL